MAVVVYPVDTGLDAGFQSEKGLPWIVGAVSVVPQPENPWTGHLGDQTERQQYEESFPMACQTCLLSFLFWTLDDLVLPRCGSAFSQAY